MHQTVFLKGNFISVVRQPHVIWHPGENLHASERRVSMQGKRIAEHLYLNLHRRQLISGLLNTIVFFYFPSPLGTEYHGQNNNHKYCLGRKRAVPQASNKLQAKHPPLILQKESMPNSFNFPSPSVNENSVRQAILSFPPVSTGGPPTAPKIFSAMPRSGL
jgi:hypothetical protein